MRLIMIIISIASITATIIILNPATPSAPKPSCEELGGEIQMTGSIAVMAGSVPMPVPIFGCILPKK